jgi:hypothetical protein
MYYPEQDERALCSLWADTLHHPETEITMRPKETHRTKSYRKAPYGIAYIRIHDTYLKSRIQAWINCLEEEWGSVNLHSVKYILKSCAFSSVDRAFRYGRKGPGFESLKARSVKQSRTLAETRHGHVLKTDDERLQALKQEQDEFHSRGL